ncbi:MAG: hypothetical protein WCN95_04175 [bacterium]
MSIAGGIVRIDWKGGTAAKQYLMIRNSLGPTNTAWSVIYTNPPPTIVSNFVFDVGATNRMLYYRIKAERP